MQQVENGITFTTLVTFGGAFLRHFHCFILPVLVVLIGFGWQFFCIHYSNGFYEFRSKANNFLGTKTFDVFLFINGVLGSILLGSCRFYIFLQVPNFL